MIGKPCDDETKDNANLLPEQRVELAKRNVEEALRVAASLGVRVHLYGVCLIDPSKRWPTSTIYYTYMG